MAEKITIRYTPMAEKSALFPRFYYEPAGRELSFGSSKESHVVISFLATSQRGRTSTAALEIPQQEFDQRFRDMAAKAGDGKIIKGEFSPRNYLMLHLSPKALVKHWEYVLDLLKILKRKRYPNMPVFLSATHEKIGYLHDLSKRGKDGLEIQLDWAEKNI
jgi:hypothetical protein